MTALAAGATVHPGFSVTLLTMFLAGLVVAVIFYFLAVGTGFGGSTPDWVPPLCVVIAGCGALSAVLGVAGQVAIWIGAA